MTWGGGRLPGVPRGQPHSTWALGSSRVTHSFTHLRTHGFIYLIIDYLGFRMLNSKSDWLMYPQVKQLFPAVTDHARYHDGPAGLPGSRLADARGREPGEGLWVAGQGHAARAQEDARLHTREASWQQEVRGTLERQVTAEIQGTR